MPSIFNTAALIIICCICMQVNGLLKKSVNRKSRHSRIHRDSMLKAHPFLKEQPLSDNMISLLSNKQRNKRFGAEQLSSLPSPSTLLQNKFITSAPKVTIKRKRGRSAKYNKVNDALSLMDSFDNDELLEWVEKMNERYRTEKVASPLVTQIVQKYRKPSDDNTNILNINDKPYDAGTFNKQLKYPIDDSSLPQVEQNKNPYPLNGFKQNNPLFKLESKRKNFELFNDNGTCGPAVDMHGDLGLGGEPLTTPTSEPTLPSFNDDCSSTTTTCRPPVTEEYEQTSQISIKDSKLAEDTLKKIILDLASINQAPGREDFPCSVNGSWSSKVAGVRLEICPDIKGNLAVNLMDLTPPSSHKTILTPEWKIHGLAPFPKQGMLILAAVNERNKHLATFIGECRTCGEVDLITGQWLVNKGSRSCNYQINTYEVAGDVWRREVLYKLRQEKLQKLCDSMNSKHDAPMQPPKMETFTGKEDMDASNTTVKQ